MISIRDDSTHAPPTVVVREARLSPHGRATNCTRSSSVRTPACHAGKPGSIPGGCATNSESLGGVEGHALNAALFGRTTSHRMRWTSGYAPLHSVRSRSAAGFESCPRDLSPDSSRDGFDVSRRQLASSVVIARSFFQRAYSLRSNKVENNPSNVAKALGGISGALLFDQRSHVQDNDMRSNGCAQNSFAFG